ncbi:hypothetical protein MLD38_013798 [Melastoma candidum]|uniref:Uncharacterized protein n=1 Tax=Melastoma candidum TaxID=119954 RepID=A0ACB9RBC1_9MYRT|nr:hypothetical protein MLD38_013798 [Melastoma candidum]
MILLVLAMVCGVYICSICLKQINVTPSMSRVFSVQSNKSSCPVQNPRSSLGRFLTCTAQSQKLTAGLNMLAIPSETLRFCRCRDIVRHWIRSITWIWLSCASKNECTAAVGLKWMLNQGVLQNHEEMVDYFKTQGAKPLNGTHKSHVHSPHEAAILAKYKPAHAAHCRGRGEESHKISRGTKLPTGCSLHGVQE